MIIPNLDAWLTRDPALQDRGDPVEYEKYDGARARATHYCRGCRRIAQWRAKQTVDGEYIYLCDEHYSKQNKGER
jgi:hypothetical protein